MSKRGRPPANEPATAYDYRRVVMIVQVLALKDPAKREEAIRLLADTWTDMKHRGINHLPTDYVVTALAQHALQHARQEKEPEYPLCAACGLPVRNAAVGSVSGGWYHPRCKPPFRAE